MGKFAMLIVTGSILGSFVFLGGDLESDGQRAETEGAYEHKSVSRLAAQTGLEMAEAALRRDPEGYRVDSVDKDIPQGRYRISASGPEEGPVVITVRATSGDRITVISSEYEISTTGSEPPEFMGGGIIVGNTLEFNEPTAVSATGSRNSNVHADNDFKINASLSVEGFGWAGNNIDNNSGKSLSDIFEPASNPDGDPVTSEGVDEMNPPRPNESEALSNADHTTHSSDSWSGVMNMGGSAKNPEVWYWGNDVKTTGNVTMNGHAVIFVANTLDIKHRFRANGQIALYVYNDLKISDEFDMRGPLYVGNTLHLQDDGELTLSGSLTAGNDFLAKGPVSISYNAADPEYFEPVGFEGSGTSEATVTRTSIRITSE